MENILVNLIVKVVQKWKLLCNFELRSKVKCTPKVRHKAFRGTL